MIYQHWHLFYLFKLREREVKLLPWVFIYSKKYSKSEGCLIEILVFISNDISFQVTLNLIKLDWEKREMSICSDSNVLKGRYLTKDWRVALVVVELVYSTLKYEKIDSGFYKSITFWMIIILIWCSSF